MNGIFIMSKKLKIAVTGGIGSGKSVFAKFLMEMSYPVISADNIAKDILLNDVSVKQKIIKEFGKNSYSDDGINTNYLAETVFSDECKIKKINAIVHPPTIKKIKDLMNNELTKGNLVFVEAALIFEANMEEIFDYVVLITAEKKIRIDRVVNRDNTTEDDVLERMENQLSEDTKKELSDFIFENNSSLDDLKNKAKFLITLLNSIVGGN